MKIASEMMVQQQLKTVQLDALVVNGFSQSQQRQLAEKIHSFHAILDDLETTLSKSKSYVQTVHDIGLEKERQKQKEMEEIRIKQEKEEELKRQQEELQKRAQEEEDQQQNEQNKQQTQLNNSDSDSKVDFSMATPHGLLADFGKNNTTDIDITGAIAAKDLPMNSPTELNGEAQSTKHIRQYSAQQTPGLDQQSLQNGSDDLGMNMNMISGLDGGELDMPDFNARMNENNNGNNSNSNDGMPLAENFEPSSSENNKDVTALNNTSAGNNLDDNEDDYLTLNDFNDFNIDWNTTGNPADLDLNGFNI